MIHPKYPQGNKTQTRIRKTKSRYPLKSFEKTKKESYWLLFNWFFLANTITIADIARINSKVIAIEVAENSGILFESSVAVGVGLLLDELALVGVEVGESLEDEEVGVGVDELQDLQR